MALNKKSTKIKEQPVVGGLKVTKNQVTNHEGADALAYGAKSELFLAATGSLHGKDQFYREGNVRDDRVSALAKAVAVKDPDWMTRFCAWLRGPGNIRTSAITIAVDAAYAWKDAGIPGGRQLVASVLQRADEPGEALAYAMATYGRNIPAGVKRGIADAATRLYSEFSWLKWDSANDGFRFADVLELTHAASSTPDQSALFKHILDARHNRDMDWLSKQLTLPMIYSNRELRKHFQAGTAAQWLNHETLRVAGFTWEDVLSAAGTTIPKHVLWNALIPTLPYMAMLRNLRNIEEAGIATARGGKVTAGILPERIKLIQERLANPDQVAKSRQLPMRFLAAYRNVRSDVFKAAINEALEQCLVNVPELPGRTLILVDMSGSMQPGYGWSTAQVGKSDISLADQASIFGSALALRAQDATLVQFGTQSEVVPVPLGTGLLRLTEKFKNMGGTNTRQAVQAHWKGHDRVLVITDEQSFSGHVFADIPKHVLKYTWQLAGYGASHAGTVDNHVALGGLSDQMFTLLPILEARQQGRWPF